MRVAGAQVVVSRPRLGERIGAVDRDHQFAAPGDAGQLGSGRVAKLRARVGGRATTDQGDAVAGTWEGGDADHSLGG